MIDKGSSIMDTVELVDLYQTARVVMDDPSRHDRMKYALEEYCLANATRLVETGVPRTQVYKALCQAVSS